MKKKCISIILIFTFLTSLTSTSYAGLWDDIKQGERDAEEVFGIIKNFFPQGEDDTQGNESPTQKDEIPVQKSEPTAQKNNPRTQYTYNRDARLVKDVQKELARIGYPVSVDGAYGPGTRKAILQFEADSGRAATGNVSPELVTALRESQPTPSPDARTGKTDQAEQQPRPSRVTTTLNSAGQAESGANKQDPINQWEVAIFLEHEGRYGVLGAGGAILDEKGIPTQLAISYDLLQSGARLLMSEGRTYIGTGYRRATQWVDFTDPIGRLPSIPVPTIQPGSGEYRETRSHTFGAEQYRVFERKRETVKIDEVKYTTKETHWKDASGVIRRYVTTVQIQTGNDVVSLISVADRVARVALPGWYSAETNRARRNAIPAAAALRAMMRSSQNTRAPVAQLPFFGSHFSDHQPILSQTFSVSGLFTPVVDLLIPRAHAGDLRDEILEKLIEKLPQPGAGLDGVLDKILAGEDIGKDFVRDEVIKLLEGELEDALKKAVEAGLVRLFPPAAFFGLGGLAADFIVPPAMKYFKTSLHGEPHITTFDEYRYGFQAIGEFIQVKTPTFMVQQRFMGSKGSNTSTKATAIQAGDHVIESYLTPHLKRSDALSVVVDGSLVEVDYEGISFDDGTYLARREAGGRFKVNTRNTLIVVDPGGSYALIENFRNAQNVSISLTDDMKRHVSGGLGGIPDGNTANDFTLRDGTVMALDETNTIEGLYGRFATSWRVRPEERLFTQGNAEDYLTAEYTEIPQAITRLSDFSQAERDRAGKICTDAGVKAGPALEDCTYDVVVTGDPEWAQMASSSEVVAAAQPPQAASGETQSEPAQATLLTSVAIEARVADGSLKNLQWTIINQSTEEMVVPEMQSTAISVELSPGNYDVLVVADGYEGESTIEVQASGANQFVVELKTRGVQDGFSSPESVPAGELMSFDWKGPAAKDDRIFIGRLDMGENQYRRSNYHKASDRSPAVLVAPAQPGPYEVRYFSYANGSVAFRKPLEVTAAKVQIKAPSEVNAGMEFTFDWKGPSAKGDLLFVAEPEMEASQYRSDADLSHKVAAGPQANLIAPPKAGDYEIRYYSYTNGHTLASSPIRVLPHAVSIEAPRTVAPGNEFEFSWKGPGARGDFLFLSEPKMEENEYYSSSDRQHYVKDGATGKLTAPTDPGTYEIRYFSHRNGSVLAKRVFLVR